MLFIAHTTNYHKTGVLLQLERRRSMRWRLYSLANSYFVLLTLHSISFCLRKYVIWRVHLQRKKPHCKRWPSSAKNFSPRPRWWLRIMKVFFKLWRKWRKRSFTTLILFTHIFMYNHCRIHHMCISFMCILFYSTHSLPLSHSLFIYMFHVRWYHQSNQTGEHPQCVG